MYLADLSPQLERARPKTYKMGQGYVSRCPVCAASGRDSKGDHLASWDGEDGWIHFKCIKGCAESDIESAFGISTEDRRHETKEEASKDPCYVYTDERGSYLFEKARAFDSKGKKTFFQFCRSRRNVPLAKVRANNGKSERYPTPTEAGVNTNYLYRLPEVLKAVKEGKTIYVNEGEKACDLMRLKGLVATCQPHGAGESKWLNEYTEWLRGASKVVVVADRDESGDKYAPAVYRSLRAAKIPCEIVWSKTENEKDDAYDHFMAGHGPEDFVPADRITPTRGMPLVTITGDFEPVQPEYTVYPYLKLGKCTLLDGNGGQGKSTMALAWAAALSRGLHPITFDPLEIGPIKTLYLHTGEDSNEELQTVYYGNKGVPGMISFPGAAIKLDDAGLDILQETIEAGNFGLVVMDSLFYFLDGAAREVNTNDNMFAIKVMTALNRIAHLTRASFLNLRHTGKSREGKAASELGMGSVAFRNSHRGQIVLRWHPEMPGVVVATDEKGSLLAPTGEPFAFRKVDNYELQYLVDFKNPFGDNPEIPDDRVSEAKAFLQRVLSGGPHLSKELYALAEKTGLSRRTLERAMKELEVKAFRETPDGPWKRRLPASKNPPAWWEKEVGNTDDDPFAD